MKNDKRAEILMPTDLYKSAKALAKAHNMTVSKLVRTLLINLLSDQIYLSDTGNKAVPITTDSTGKCSYVSNCDPHIVYDFAIEASRHNMSRSQLSEMLMEAVIEGRISIDILKCGCHQ